MSAWTGTANPRAKRISKAFFITRSECRKIPGVGNGKMRGIGKKKEISVNFPCRGLRVVLGLLLPTVLRSEMSKGSFVQRCVAEACLLGGAFVLLFAGAGKAGESYIAVDSFTGKIVFELDSERRVSVAGLTKVATAMVVLDWSRLSKSSMAEVAIVPTTAAGRGGANPMRLIPGDRISLREAMYSMLLAGDDVAAYTLADHAGRSIQARSGGESPVSAFVAEMNHLARGLGMMRTRFTSPEGTAIDGGNNRSTARDMARLGIYAMRNSGFQFYVKQRQRTVSSYRGNLKRPFRLSNLHQMVGTGNVNGIINGGMVGAGGCLLTSSERKPKVTKFPGGGSSVLTRRLILVSLRNPNPWGISQKLIEQGWPAYDGWRKQGSPVSQARELLRVTDPK